MSYQYITGIDPGTTETGIVIINFEATIIVYCEKISNIALINMIDHEGLPLLRNSYIGIESARPMGMRVGSTTFETLKWEGKFQQAIKYYHGRYPREISRKHVLGTLLGDTNGNDTKLRSKLIKIYGKDFVRQLNCTDKRAALGVALTLREDLIKNV